MSDLSSDAVLLEDFADRIRPRAMSNILLWGIFGFIVLFILWAALTELDRSVQGQGRVIPSAQLQIVSNLEGGVVEQILVKTGMNVKAGDPLVLLSPVQSTAEFGSNAATTGALSAKVARLEAEMVGREPLYPQLTDPLTQDQIKIEQALHQARLADLSSSNNAGQARINQAQRAVAEAEALIAAKVTQRNSTQREMEIIRPLVERGIEPRMTLMQLESQASVSASEVSGAQASASRARAGVAEAQAALSQYRQDWRSKTGTELAAAQAELSARTRTTGALADRLARTTVRSPLSGRINRVLVATVGGSVRPSEPIVEIVPSEDGLIVEALVLTKDIAFVSLNQVAKVDITAYDSAVYGSLHGKVISISPDAIINERTGEAHFIVRVRTDENALIDKSGRRLPIGTGMTSNISVLGEKRSVLSYILTPITRLSEKALRE
jgi:membrane fusion protein, adhesin transport system